MPWLTHKNVGGGKFFTNMDNAPSKKPMKFGVKILLNLLAMAFIGILLLWLGTLWLDVWTDHGEYQEVPDVRRMAYDDAVQRLEKDGFVVEFSDSVYDNSAAPGMVVEQNPKVNTKVKHARTVYLTVNAFAPRSVTLPALTDMSLRQARSILEGLGVKNIEVREVPSEYQDLVLNVTRDGHRLMPGARIPTTGTVVIEVGAGMLENEGDSLALDTNDIDFLDLN